MTLGRAIVAVAVIAVAAIAGYTLYDTYWGDDDASSEVRYVIDGVTDDGTVTGPFEGQRTHGVEIHYFADVDKEMEVTAWVGNVRLDTITGITSVVYPVVDSYTINAVLPDGMTVQDVRDGIVLQFDGVDGERIVLSDGTDGAPEFVLEYAAVGTLEHNGEDVSLLYLMVNFTSDTEPTFKVGDVRLQEAEGLADIDGLFELTRLAGVDQMLYVFDMPSGITVDDVRDDLSAYFGGVQGERVSL